MSAPIGTGTYNVVYKYDVNSAIRITRKKLRGDIETAIVRSEALGRLFERNSNKMGPCLLRQGKGGFYNGYANVLAPYKRFVDPGYTDMMYIQLIELLLPYEEVKDDDDFNVMDMAYMLMWFLNVAQCEFGFRHSDLKPANILFRKTPAQFTYTFVLAADNVHSITTSIVPVIIDYDFGSVFTSTHWIRNSIGTYMYQPPEKLLVLNGWKNSIYPTTDIFSMGAIIVEWMGDDNILGDTTELQIAFIMAMHVYKMDDDKEFDIRKKGGLFTTALLHFVLDVEEFPENMPPPMKTFIENILSKNVAVKAYKKNLLEKFPAKLLEAVKYMLSFDPDNRLFEGYIAPYLPFLERHSEEGTFMEDMTYRYSEWPILDYCCEYGDDLAVNERLQIRRAGLIKELAMYPHLADRIN